MTNALIILCLILSTILLGLATETLVKGKKRDLDLTRLTAENAAQIRFLVEHINRDMAERAARYREARRGR
jgi:hypothetical protein